jgi:hypothetical protein
MQITSTRPFGISGIHLETDFNENAQAQREFCQDSCICFKKTHVYETCWTLLLQKTPHFRRRYPKFHGLDLTLHCSRLLLQFVLSSLYEAVIGLVGQASNISDLKASLLLRCNTTSLDSRVQMLLTTYFCDL